METWRPIVGHEDRYEVSSSGNVRNIITGRQLKAHLSVNGYYRVVLYSNSGVKTCPVHRLVAGSFLPNPENLPVVNHIDSNPKNNDVENLEWCTYKHNTQHSFAVGRKSRGFRNEKFARKKRGDGDNRSFPEVWASLTKTVQWGLKKALEYRCSTTSQTVWNWTNGYTQPSTPEEIEKIARVTRKVTGLNVYPETLFPAR